jgi:hypothetical protein
MENQLNVLIVDDETISIAGQALVERADIVDALRTAVQGDPGVILVIEPKQNGYYKGIGKVIYASQHAGVPVENLRYTTEDGEVLTFDELRARHPAPSS